jgi:hypothetical protein
MAACSGMPTAITARADILSRREYPCYWMAIYPGFTIRQALPGGGQD